MVTKHYLNTEELHFLMQWRKNQCTKTNKVWKGYNLDLLAAVHFHHLIKWTLMGHSGQQQQLLRFYFQECSSSLKEKRLEKGHPFNVSSPLGDAFSSSSRHKLPSRCLRSSLIPFPDLFFHSGKKNINWFGSAPASLVVPATIFE